MSKKPKKKQRQNEEEAPSFFSRISKETLNAILGVLSSLVTVFLIAAAFSKGGMVGTWAYGLLSYLFGVGYYLVPLVFALLAVSFFQSKEKDFALPQTLGAMLFFVSSLGLTNLLAVNDGGVVGGFISSPLISLFDKPLSIVILIALIIISLLVVLDQRIKFDLMSLYARLFKKGGVDDSLETGESKAVEKAVEKAENVGNNVPAEKVSSNPVKKLFSSNDDSEGFVPMISKRQTLGSPTTFITRKR
jgi:hypothetical protein